MPREDIYGRQVAIKPAAAMPLARPEDYGAGLAGQVGTAAANQNRRLIENYELDRKDTANAETARVHRMFGEAREAQTEDARISQSEADVAGHLPRMRSAWEKRQAAMLEGITEDAVRQRAAGSADEWYRNFAIGQGDWVEAQRVNQVAYDAKSTVNTIHDRARTLEDPNQIPGELQIGYDFIDGLDLPEDAKNKWRDELYQGYADNYLRGLGERDPDMHDAQINSGMWEDVDRDVINAALNRSDTERRSRAVEQRRIAAEALAQVREAAGLELAKLGNGIAVDDDVLAALVQQATAAGDDRLVEQLLDGSATNKFNRIWEKAPPVAREARLLELAGLPKPTEEQQREIAYHRRTLPGISEQWAADPAGAAGRATGGVAIDWNDPATVRRAEAWAAEQTEVNGRPVPPITREQARPLAELREQKNDGAVFAALDQFEDPFARRRAAQVISPNDPLFQQLAVMRRDTRDIARSGAAALDAKPQMLKPVEPGSDGDEFKQRWELNLAIALKGMDPEDAEAVRRSAEYILAGSMSRYPGRTIDDLPEADFQRAIQMALGSEVRGNTRLGGIATWADHPFIVAPGYNAAGITAALQRNRDRRDAAGTGPVNPDGSPAILRNAIPVWLGGVSYRWETRAGRPIVTAEGQPFIQELGR